MSHPSADGGVVLLAVPPFGAVTVAFVDEPTPRDITELVPDLLLIGLTLLSEPQPGDAERVTVGTVGWVGDPPTVLYCHPGGRYAKMFAFADMVEVLELAVAAQVTAGVDGDRGGT